MFSKTSLYIYQNINLNLAHNYNRLVFSSLISDMATLKRTKSTTYSITNHFCNTSFIKPHIYKK